MRKLLHITGVALLVATGGCLNGRVKDAQTGSALDGVDVHAFGTCTGAGCVGADHGKETTFTGGPFVGEFLFDAYGDHWGAARKQVVSPAEGADSIKLVYAPRDGVHLTRTVYHRPTYETMTGHVQGKDKSYLVSFVPIQYLCKTGQRDLDGDGICDAAEARYGTNPNAADTDGDGFTDGDELFGLDCSGIDLAYYGASPTHKDVFVYYNYYTRPDATALANVVQAFANAPNTNPDGTSGITLHLMEGKQIAASDPLYTPVFYEHVASEPNWRQPFNAIKAKYLPPRYASFAHYVLFATTFKVLESDGKLHSKGGATKGAPAHDSLVTASPVDSSPVQQAAVFMHELGHALGLMHGGNDDVNVKPNYFSVMNYLYSSTGLFRDNGDGKGYVDGVLDYSRMTVAAVNEFNVVEIGPSSVSGMTALPPTSSTELSKYLLKPYSSWSPIAPVAGHADGPLDFDGSGTWVNGPSAIDINHDGVYETFPASQNDWEALLYTGHQDGGGIIGCPDLRKSLAPQRVADSAPIEEFDRE